MPTGICRLCGQNAELQDSHLLPKAFYKLAWAAGGRNPNPIVVTPKVALKTSRQVSDYLLCRDCEERFNKGGEKWIVENCWRGETDFPLNAALKAATPIAGSKPDLMIYFGASIPAIDLERIVYFAASVFWRAAVNDWGENPIKLDLGPYEDSLRRFLLGLQ